MNNTESWIELLINKDTNLDKKINMMVIILISLSFVLSDWLISFLTVSDILMLFVIGILSLNGFDFKKIDKTSLFVLEGYLLLHMVLHTFLNTDFTLKIAVTNFIKIVYYHFFIVVTYRYIITKNLQKMFLIVLNIFAVVSILIGLYITVNIIFETDLPYKFFWFLTRDDRFSYTLRGTNTIIRTRSIFSEPAHLGYFLNIILSFNLFTKHTFRGIKYINMILIIGVIATLSYSSIGALLIILFLYSVLMIGKVKLTLLKSLIFVFVLSVTVFIFRDFLYEAIYVRTLDILAGNDGSVITRLFSSWSYIDLENIVLGNGLGHTPPIQNIYAYFLSDLGIIPFVLSIIFTLLILKTNYGVGITFLVLNFSKGGYLSPIFTLYLLSLLILVINVPKSNQYNELDIGRLE